MKITSFILVIVLLAVAGCGKKAQKDPHAGLDMERMKSMMENPHGQMAESGGLDLDAMLSDLPEGWTRSEPTSSMRLAQISLAPAKGDKDAADLAVSHFPGSGGSSSANIVRWQNQFKGPKGEPGPEVAKTDTTMVGLLTVVTTDVTGTQLAQSGTMGPDKDAPNSRMIASVIETPSGNWFIKVVGPAKTVAAHEKKIHDFIKRAKLKDLPHS
ncbi:MAG: hypothetical protein NT025_08790 [bacterium]|nr:hypothetical protein [bacterium]